MHIRIPRPLPDRCSHCGKLCYQGKQAAERKAKLARHNGDLELHAYRCAGGRWHVGHGERPIRRMD